MEFNNNFVPLGVAAVLDPSNLSEGDYIVLEKLLFKVNFDPKNEQSVFLTAVIGKELWLYRVKKHLFILKILVLGIFLLAFWVYLKYN